MTDTPQTEERIQSTTPYSGAYQATMYDEDPATEEVEGEPVEEGPKEQGFLATQPDTEVDYKKRYDDLKGHYDRKVNEHKQEMERKEAELTVESRMAKSTKSPEELAEFAAEYGEVYDVVDTMATNAATEVVAEMKVKMAEMEEKHAKELADSSYSELLGYHPDFVTLSQDDNFKAWLADQPEQLSRAVTHNSTDAKWAAKVITLYKQEAGVKSKPAPVDNSAAMEINTGQRPAPQEKVEGKVWKRSEIAALKKHQYDDALEAELDAAALEGRIVDG